MKDKCLLRRVFCHLHKNIEDENVNEDNIQEIWSDGLEPSESQGNIIYCYDPEHKKCSSYMLIGSIRTEVYNQ